MLDGHEIAVTEVGASRHGRLWFLVQSNKGLSREARILLCEIVRKVGPEVLGRDRFRKSKRWPDFGGVRITLRRRVKPHDISPTICTLLAQSIRAALGTELNHAVGEQVIKFRKRRKR